jgi:hypothetical protein
MADYQKVSEGFDDGLIIGNTTSDKVAFFAAAPVAQQTGPAVAVTAGATTTVCNTAVGELQTMLINLGLCAAAQS